MMFIWAVSKELCCIWKLTSLLDLAALRRKHQLDQFFGHLRLESFVVSFVDADDVGDHPSVTAIRIDVELGRAGSRQKPPGRIGRILTRAVVYVTRLRVHDLLWTPPRTTVVFRRPSGRLGQTFLIHFAPACLEDEREVGGWRFTQGCHSRGKTRRPGGSCSGCRNARRTEL